MKSGSVCSGYGGLDLAADMALGASDTAWHVENDEAARKVLEQHWPGVPNLGDITAVDWSTAEPVDRVTSGVPCQPVSDGGARRGEHDPRWLWPYAFRAVSALRPAEVVFENVSGLLAQRHRHLFDGICTDLQGIGYDVRWLLMGACVVGACHHRHRVFLLALETGTLVGPDPVRVDAPVCGASRLDGPRLLPTPLARDGDGRSEGNADYWNVRPVRTKQSRGMPLGAAVRNQWARYAAAVELWALTSGVPAPEPLTAGPRGGVRMTAELPEWMMGLTAGHLTSHLGWNDAVRLAGNGVMPRHGAAALRLLADYERPKAPKRGRR